MRLRSPLLAVLAAALVSVLPGARPAASAVNQLVAVVIDFGPGGPAPIVKCVEARGQSQYQAVVDAVGGLGNTRFASSGLLCGVEGYPSTGCGVQTGGGYAYWAVFNGSAAGWSYANDNPGVVVASPATAIGLRFEPAGAGGASDPAPAASSVPAIDCPVSPSAPSTTSTTTAPVLGAGGSSAPVTTTTPAAAVTTTTAPVTTTVSRGRAVAFAEKLSAGRSTGSSPLPTLLGVGVFGFLAIASGVLIRRRRRAS